MSSKQEGFLPVDKLSKEAQQTRLFDNLRTPLVSLGQLCDDDCEIWLNKSEIRVYKNKEEILRGPRNKFNGMWEFPMDNGTQQMNTIQRACTTRKNILEIPKVYNKTGEHTCTARGKILENPKVCNQSGVYKIKKVQEIVEFLHACAFVPVKNTWCKAIEKEFLQHGQTYWQS